MNSYLKLIVTALAISAFSIASCKKEEEPKTNQECMDESGIAFYSNANGDCEYAHSLAITSATNHWSTNFYELQFIRNGSNTSGTGKMKYNNGAVSTFSWSMDANNVKTIICSGYDSVYPVANQITQVTNIEPNSGANPTGFSASYTAGTGTVNVNFNLVGGAL